jgi:hypothetical protein
MEKSNCFIHKINWYTPSTTVFLLRSMKLTLNTTELVPDSTIYLSNRAAAYMSLKMYAESLADCEKALEYDPTFLKVRPLTITSATLKFETFF